MNRTLIEALKVEYAGYIKRGLSARAQDVLDQIGVYGGTADDLETITVIEVVDDLPVATAPRPVAKKKAK